MPGSVWSHPGYRRLWSARTASAWGDAFATVALSLLVLDRTGSGLGVAGVVVAEIVPVLVLAPIAGVLVDRFNPVRVMVAADLARVVLAAALPLVAGSVPAIYALAFGLSAAGVFFNPAAGATLPTLVTQDELVSANSGIWTAAVLSQVVLAPLAGVVVLAVGYGPAFWINAGSFAASALILVGFRPAQRPAGTARRHWWAQVREGAAVVVHDRLLRALAAGQVLAALSAGATSALLVILIRERLHLDARGYGLALGVIGVGAALGPALLSRVRNPRRPDLVKPPRRVERSRRTRTEHRRTDGQDGVAQAFAERARSDRGRSTEITTGYAASSEAAPTPGYAGRSSTNPTPTQSDAQTHRQSRLFDHQLVPEPADKRCRFPTA